jgi:endonuclease/exonuclease/phosphatase family metal-dependent hydrolase
MVRFVLLNLMLGMFTFAAFAQSGGPNEPLLETGRAAQINRTNTPAPKEPTIITYNIRWRTGTELQTIIDWLKKSPDVVIIALQEVDRDKPRTNKTNNARALAEGLGMYYAWTAPPPAPGDREEETGVELLSRYPLTAVTRIVLPHEGPGGRSRVALGATIQFGKVSWRVYSVHSETRIAVSQKMDQLRAVLDDLARYPKGTPAVVMGDFNTWEPDSLDAVHSLFANQGLATPFSDSESTFKRNAIVFDINLKLDWIWLRGLNAKSFGIERSVTVSDHFPLYATLSELKAATGTASK